MAIAQASSNGHNTSLYVWNLSPDVTEDMLLKKFNQVGPVKSIQVFRKDVHNERSLKYAYVNFDRPADAKSALDIMNYYPFYGEACRIKWDLRDHPPCRSNVSKIFINNLDHSTDRKTLHGTFSPFGNIISCEVITNRKDGSSKGFGYVQFDSKESADLAIRTTNGMLINDKKVYVGKFLPAKQRYTNVKNLDKDFDDITLAQLSKAAPPDQGSKHVTAQRNIRLLPPPHPSPGYLERAAQYNQLIKLLNTNQVQVSTSACLHS